MLSALLLHALLAAAAASAPPPAWTAPSLRNYGMAEGLPSSNIDALAQDSRGYVWVATESGLARYDGNRFRIWRHDPRDPRSLSAAPLATLMADAQGQLWGGSRDGLVRYDPAQENFDHWRHDPADPASAGSDDVTALARLPQGELWIGHFDVGLDRMRPDGRGFEHVRHDPADPGSIASDTVYSLLADADGTLWIGTGRGLDRRAPDGRIGHLAFARPDDASRDKPLKIYHLLRADGTLYIASNRGLYALAPGAAAAAPVAPDVLPHSLIYSLATDAQHRLWIGTNDGIYLRDADGGYRHIEARPLLRRGLPNGFITQLLRDHEGGLWIGTYNGLAYLSPRWGDFQYVTHVPENPDSIVPGAYYDVASNGGDHLWLAGADGAIDRLDLATGKVRHLAFHIPQGRSANCLAEDARGRLWVASASGSFVLDGDKATELDAPMAERIVFGADGTAYLQVDDGVFAYDPDTFKARPLNLGAQAKGVTLSDMRLHDGALWFATSAGVLRWAPGDAQARPLEGVPATAFNLLDLRDGRLWLLDEQNLGAYRLDGLRAVPVATYALYRQHPLGDVLGMHADGLGRVWFFARSGLWRYDPASGKVREPGLEQGLPEGQFSNVNHVLLADGRVAAATNDGIAIFVPEAIGEQSHAPRVRLEDGSVRRGGKSVRLGAEAQPWQLAWSDRDLTVTARALTYLAPERTHYRFRLDGLDNDWVDTGARGDRSFTQLPGGDYVLRVQAAGPDGAWGETPALRIHADSPPWLRWWAWLAYALLLALLFAALLAAMRRRQAQRHRLELITQQHQLAQAASRAKTQFLAELGHEIRTPMTGVLGMAELLLSRPLGQTERHYAQTIRNSGEVLLTLVNDALDLARIEAGRLQLNPAPFDPRALLHDVAELQRGRAVSRGLELRVQVDRDVPAHVAGDAVRVRQILLNLSGNALKFTEHGEVRLTLDTNRDGLVFAVSDTGPGIAPADQAKLFQHYQQLDSPQRGSGSGLGLAICRELAGLMGGRIELASAPGAGSTFRVHLPLPAAPSPAQRAARSGDGPRWQLLLLEDDATVAAVIAGLLEAQGHAVEHVPNALHAMEALERQRFDAALVDLDLPGLDGFQWAGLVRSREHGKRLPMIAITARSGGDEESRAYAAGMDGFLRKPLHGEQLAQALAAVLASVPAESAS